MATITTAPAQLTVKVDLIDAPENVRELDRERVHSLAGSIALQGVLVPIVVRAAGERYELVAGFHRLAAVHELGPAAIEEIPVVIRDQQTEKADRAIENIARKALRLDEKARAVEAMLATGLSEDSAARALGWPKARVTARMRLLALPQPAREMVGAGVIALSAVEPLLAIGRVSPELLDAVIAYLADGNQWAAERLAREPGWVLDAAVREGDATVFAEHLGHIDSYQIAQLRLGRKTEQLLEEATALHKQLDRYAYSGPTIRFTEQDVDQARAAGVLIEFERSVPVIVDRSLYRELAKAAVKRTVTELQQKVAARETEKKNSRAGRKPADPVAEARREEQRQLRELSEQAHGVNLDLGTSLLNELSVVDPADMDVARFLVYALLGPDRDASPYTQTGERIQQLAVAGIRLVIDELRADVTKTLKDGTRGRLRIDYGDPKQPEAALRWLWRYVDGAKSAGELYGRALVVIAAEQHAARMVLPASQRTRRMQWGSHKDLAAKALRKLAGPHLPTSLKQLERAVARANKQAQDAHHGQPTATSNPTADTAPLQNESADGQPVANVQDADRVSADEPGEPAAGDA